MALVILRGKRNVEYYANVKECLYCILWTDIWQLLDTTVRPCVSAYISKNKRAF